MFFQNKCTHVVLNVLLQTYQRHNCVNMFCVCHNMASVKEVTTVEFDVSVQFGFPTATSIFSAMRLEHLHSVESHLNVIW